MHIKQFVDEAPHAIKIIAEENGKEIGRAFLFVLHNGLHEAYFGLMEDVFVDEAYRGRGIGRQLVQAVIDEAKARGCYKLIGTSRYGRDQLHAFYAGMGFKDHGKSFRLDLA